MRSRATVTVAAVVTLWAATAGAQPPAKSAELDQIKLRLARIENAVTNHARPAPNPTFGNF